MNASRSTLFALALAGATTLSSIAEAASNYGAKPGQQWPRWYAGVSGGVEFLNDSDIKATPNGNLEYDSVGGVVTGSIGYMLPFEQAFWNGFRLEGEFGYHSIGLDSYTAGGTTSAAGGQARVLSYMGNVYYDFRNQSRWTPYVGGGAGLANFHIDRNKVGGNTETSDDVFAWQLMTGLSYAPASIPMTEWSLGYRYFTLSDPKLQAGASRVRFDDFNAHSVEVGAKFRF